MKSGPLAALLAGLGACGMIGALSSGPQAPASPFESLFALCVEATDGAWPLLSLCLGAGG